VEIAGVSCDDGAMNLSSFFSQDGRLGRGPFTLAVIAVYLASFVSQMLLSAPVTAQVSIVPFVLVQVALIWLWIVLHSRRLRDAGRPTGIVIGIAMIYVLEVVLLVMLIWLILATTGPTGGASTDASIFQLFVILYLLGMMTGDPSLGALQIWMMGFAAVMLLPVAISVVFSIWAATRPKTAPPP
jgi:uncharacterized membrane protein YhaH (DUF805 family)